MIDTIPLSRILFVLCALVLFGYAYNTYVVERAERFIPARWNITAFEVVLGTLVTLAGLAYMIGPARVTGLEVLLLGFVCFAASGAPMFYGSVTRAERLPG